MERNGRFKEERRMADKKVSVKGNNDKKKSGCVNLAVVQAGYNGKKWTI